MQLLEADKNSSNETLIKIIEMFKSDPDFDEYLYKFASV